MNYQLVTAPSEGSALVIGFQPEQDNPHLISDQLKNYLTGQTLPKKKNASIWLCLDQNSCMLYNVGDVISASNLAQAITKAVKEANGLGLSVLTLCLPSLESPRLTTINSVMAIENALYEFAIKEKAPEPSSLETIELLIHNAQSTDLSEAQAIAAGVNFTKDLANLPPNHCTPSWLAEKAHEVAARCSNMKAIVHEEAELEAMGMEAMLSVSKGSDEPAKFIELHYTNGGNKAPIILVGKGITFDAGGLSLKPPTAMMEMKYDMCGAATVLGIMHALTQLSLPLNVIGLVAASENLPGPSALKPGDIIKSYSGKTIEVLNTDAEGRLVLCDALSYASQFKPQKVIDIATLTGAMIIALGHKTNGIMGNDQSLCDELFKAGQTIEDKAWQLPLWEEYHTLMESNVADICNINTDRSAGSITAGCFLAKFAEQYPWVHIDCAGTAWQTGKNKAATGRPVPLLMQFLLEQC